MRITQFYGHGGANGVTSYIRDTSDRLRKQGHDVAIVCRADSELATIPGRTSYRVAFWLRRLLSKHIRDFNPDVFSVHSEIDADVALGVARESGVSACYTAHEASDEAAHFAPLADCVIAVSNGVGRFLRENYPLSDGALHVIPNGIDPARLPRESRQALRRENGFRDDEIVFCFAGRLVDNKNVLGLVRAFGRIANSHPGLRLVVIGDGKRRADILRLGKHLGIGERMELRGWLPRDVTLRTIGASDAFVLPSQRAEGLSIAMLEAMAMAIPVVATDILSLTEGPVRDGETGWLCAPDDQALARALQRVASASAAERSSIGKAALAEIEQNHRLERVAEQLEGVYRSAMEIKAPTCRATAV
ncbi:MAG: glycosyltransferase family 4 protein [Polyangiaceae bacterium]